MSVPPDDDLSELEQLLAEGLECAESERDAWLEALTARAPDQARVVREQLGLLGAFGLGAVRGALGNRRLGEYRLVERVGIGGMGEVWRAEHSDGSVVALKLVRPELLWFEGARRRFEHEARAASALDHEGIVHVLEVGVDDGLPWMALEWVDGANLEDVLANLRGRVPSTLEPADFRQSLAGLCESAPSAAGERLAGSTYPQLIAELTARVADALHHAHARGVVHRDVKPSNILIAADGRVLLADFGLALPTGVTRLTRTGAWLGSMPYAAPEQFAGAADADARSDIYSLGATLFECIALQPPFHGDRESDLRKRIATGSRSRLRSATAGVSRELELVCDRAMDLTPARRYASAGLLADDLRRAARGDSVQARSVPAWLRATRWSRRHTALTLIAVLALVVLVTTSVWAVRESMISARILRMADAELVARLADESHSLWPPSAARVPIIDDWLQRAEALLARKSEHERALDRLRARADERDAGMGHPEAATQREELIGLRLEVEGLAHLLLANPAERANLLPLDVDAVRLSTAGWTAAYDHDLSGFFDEFEARMATLRDTVEERGAPSALDLEQLRSLEDLAADRRRALLEQRRSHFTDEIEQWRHDELAKLVAALDALEPQVAFVRDLHARCLAVAESTERYAAAWAQTCEQLAHPDAGPAIRMQPIPGVVPLRRNAQSGLFEFLLVGSGAVPIDAPSIDDPAGYAVDADTGVILVLVPGGEFLMGEVETPRSLTPAAAPPHRVALDPYLISKYELTNAQAQRLRITSEVYRATPGFDALPVRVHWEPGRQLLLPHGLDHPTEAQWEFAATCGGLLERFDDSSVLGRLLPVAAGKPNAFGLYGMTGNAGEWCRDWFIMRGYRSIPSRPGDGLKETVWPGPGRSVRGGNFAESKLLLDPRHRQYGNLSNASTTGLRPVMRVDVQR